MEALAKNEAKTRALTGKVALVAGAPRGAGRAIAVSLPARAPRSTPPGAAARAGRSEINRPETIEETGELIAAGRYFQSLLARWFLATSTQAALVPTR